MRNIRLDICYDGTRYQGWQRLANTPNSIQGKIETALSRILEEPIEISGSGRTDAGVHAKDQVANFHCESTMSCGEILAKLQMYLPEDIGIESCKEVSPRFHARLNAKEKTYLEFQPSLCIRAPVCDGDSRAAGCGPDEPRGTGIFGNPRFFCVLRQ